MDGGFLHAAFEQVVLTPMRESGTVVPAKMQEILFDIFRGGAAAAFAELRTKQLLVEGPAVEAVIDEIREQPH